ncbi:hypothetical protein LTR85_004884 [Meristemomyces frigidus]|nr:hypothetical protein LTR85_004884 [Meristemomyces frigidus]
MVHAARHVQKERRRDRWHETIASLWTEETLADTSDPEAAGTATTSTSTSANNALRSMNMNTYGVATQQQQQQPAARQPSRLQNTQKTALGNGLGGGGWGGVGVGGGGFGGVLPSGGGGGGGLGAGVVQASAPAPLRGFAQVMGGGSGQGPIDMSMARKKWAKLDLPTNISSNSDFPTLSGGPRQAAAPSNAAIAGWNSAAIRQTSVQQPSQQQQAQQSQPQPQQQHQQQQRAPSAAPSQQSIDQFDGQRSSVPSSLDNNRGAGAGGAADDFPPLGGAVNGDGNGNILGQSNGFGSSSIASPDNSSPLAARVPNGGGLQQTELSIRQASSNASSSFPQQPSQQQAPIGSNQGAAQQAAQLPQQHVQSTPVGQSSQLQMQPAVQQNGQQNTRQSAASTTTALPPGVKRYADMSDNEKYGLAALVAAFEARRTLEAGAQPDQTLPPAMRNAVFLGQDLNSLGLDLESPEALYTTFTPFPSSTTTSAGSLLHGLPSTDTHDRHRMIPDFTLPSAYTVTNVPPLSGRMGSFSDETLFSIFYQHPRDLLQELAGIELTARDWRWHRVLRQWLQKDTHLTSNGNAGQHNSTATGHAGAGGGGGGAGSGGGNASLPIVDLAGAAFPAVRVGANVERGVYVFFDAGNWRRERREFVLDYGELDNRHAGGPSAGVGGMIAGVGVNGGAGMVGGGVNASAANVSGANGMGALPSSLGATNGVVAAGHTSSGLVGGGVGGAVPTTAPPPGMGLALPGMGVAGSAAGNGQTALVGQQQMQSA